MVVATVLRLALLDYVEFKGDEAQVAGTVRDMLESGRLVQTGMITSVGPLNPPLFDYIMAIPLAFSSDPRVATAFIGVVNVLAVVVTYAVALRLWERAGSRSPWAAAVPALLFALAPWAVVFSRKIWAPELEPFFAAWCLLGILQARAGGPRSAWWAGLALGSWLWMAQLHPAALLLAPVFLIAGPRMWRRLRPVPVAVGLAAGLLPLYPYLRYDAAHGWTNVRGFVAAAGQTPTVDLTSVLFAFMDVTSLNTLQLEGVPYSHFTPVAGLFSLHSAIASAIMAIALAAVIVACAAGLVRPRGDIGRQVAGDLLVLLAWFWLPVLLTIRHAAPLFQHYYLILFPSSFLLIGFGLSVIGGWMVRSGDAARAARADDTPPSPGAERAWRRASWRVALAVSALLFLAVGWLALVGSLYAYLPSGRSVADFGVPLKTTMGVADLAKKAAADGQLWLVVGDDTAPMLSYLLRGQRSSSGSPPLRLPSDALVLPSAGSSAGYVLDDATLPAARALAAAGATTVGEVPFPGSQTRAVGMAWRSGATAGALAAPLTPIAVRLANGVELLAVGTSMVGSRDLRVEYVWRVGRGGPGVTRADLAIYTHLVDARGTMVAQKDGMPYPSARWEAGETIAAWFEVPLQAVPAGRYELRSGMYARPSVERVPMLDENGRQRDGEFSVGSLTIA